MKNTEHQGDTFLVDEAFFEDHSVGDTLHTVLNQELERIAIGCHKEVSCSNLSNDEFDLEATRESLRFADFHDGFLEMVVTRHGSDGDVDMLALGEDAFTVRVQSVDKFSSIISKTSLKAWHFEIYSAKLFITKMLAEGVREPSFTATWDTSDEDDWDERVRLVGIAAQLFSQLR